MILRALFAQTSWGPWEAFRNTAFFSGKTTSGVTVGEETAMRCAAVYAAVTLLAGSIASVPVGLYRRIKLNGKDGKEAAKDHPSYRLVHDEPNEYMTSAAFREATHGFVELHGNGYAEIERDGETPLALYPRRADRVVQKIEDGELYYEIRDHPSGLIRRVDPRNMLHIPNFGGDGICGYSTIRLFREAIGLAVAAEKYGGGFFGNQSRPAGIWKIPGIMPPEQAKATRAELEKFHAGPDNAWRSAFLQGGMEWQNVGMTNLDAQFLENRKYQVADIARIFGVPAHMIGAMEEAANNKIEQQNLNYVVHSLTRRVVKWEQELSRKLLTEDERAEYFFEFNLSGLLRGDLESRKNYYATARQWGWMSVNDILAKENENPIEDGDEYLRPVNMMVVGEEPPAQVQRIQPEREAPEDLADNSALRASLRSAILRAMTPVVRLEANKVAKQKNAPRAKFLEWFNDFVAEHRAFIESAIGDTVALACAACSTGNAAELTQAAVGKHIAALTELVGQADTSQTADWIKTVGGDVVADYCIGRLCPEEK